VSSHARGELHGGRGTRACRRAAAAASGASTTAGGGVASAVRGQVLQSGESCGGDVASAGSQLVSPFNAVLGDLGRDANVLNVDVSAGSGGDSQSLAPLDGGLGALRPHNFVFGPASSDSSVAAAADSAVALAA
jgi:hypothetical protein